MFGLPLYSELLHGSALRTWNCVAHVVGVLWQKVVHGLGDINNMPRSRRRHHSRSRSRSNSQDRDREPKRRKVENFESPHSRRSVSSEPESNETDEKMAISNCPIENLDAHAADVVNVDADDVVDMDNTRASDSEVEETEADADVSLPNSEASCTPKCDAALDTSESVIDSNSSANADASSATADATNATIDATNTNTPLLVVKQMPTGVNTPSKALTPKQLQKKLESEKKKAERQREKEARLLKLQQERDEKLKQKQLQQQEKDLIREAKEAAKRKEREKKEERKEAERLKRQAEIDEKNREKQKLEEKRQKAAAAFTKFFLPKAASEAKKEVKLENTVNSATNFMPFQLKNDMHLAPVTRNSLTDAEKDQLVQQLVKQADDIIGEYLKNVREFSRKSDKTLALQSPSDDDVIFMESDQSKTKMKAKFLKFHENQRPAYYGTWRKKSTFVNGKHPLGKDPIMNYDVDSDDEWEDEEEGEDIAGSDEEEKEPDSENDYEVDDEFFVPHGHLSDDEENDEENISPEMRKAKEKLLKNQFDEERKLKTQRLKPSVLGCIWYNNNNNEDGAVDDAIDKALKPFAIISNGEVEIKPRTEFKVQEKSWSLDQQYMPDLLKLLHGNVHGKKSLCHEFFEYLTSKSADVVVNKCGFGRLIKSIAKWSKCRLDGPMLNKMCWVVNEDVLAKFADVVQVKMPNEWQYCTDMKLKSKDSREVEV